MLALQAQDPSLDYRELKIAAVQRELPDTAFHVSRSGNFISILRHGLLARDPRRSTLGRAVPPSQPIAVYLSDVYEAMQGRHAPDLEPGETVHVWRVDHLLELAPSWQQDHLNPTCWAVLGPIPARHLSLHHSFSFAT